MITCCKLVCFYYLIYFDLTLYNSRFWSCLHNCHLSCTFSIYFSYLIQLIPSSITWFLLCTDPFHCDHVFFHKLLRLPGAWHTFISTDIYRKDHSNSYCQWHSNSHSHNLSPSQYISHSHRFIWCHNKIHTNIQIYLYSYRQSHSQRHWSVMGNDTFINTDTDTGKDTVSF